MNFRFAGDKHDLNTIFFESRSDSKRKKKKWNVEEEEVGGGEGGGLIDRGWRRGFFSKGVKIQVAVWIGSKFERGA